VIAALATLAFLIAGWAALYAVVMTSDDSGVKIVEALKGRSLAAEPMVLRPVTIRYAPRPVPRMQTMRAKVEWRAAA
jgi:hypothetical protein